jgi:prepilin-type N-terminal cleavage/methylation domain-containing protein
MHSFFSFLFPARRRLSAASASRRRAAFSLVEMTTVMAVITVIAGIAFPAVKGITGANAMDVGAGKLGSLMTLARSEAIARHTIVRFVVATDWPGRGSDASFRRMSLWSWQPDTATYGQLTNWDELPDGVIIERTLPDYIRGASYAAADATTVRGSYILDESQSADASLTVDTGDGPITGRFIEFLPSGAARIPGSPDRRAIFVATQGFGNSDKHIVYTSQSNNRPANWAQVNVDALTGRVHIYRP